MGMTDTVTRNLINVEDVMTRRAVQLTINPIADRFSSQALNSAGLVINGAGTATAKIGATDFYAVANGTLVKVAAGTAMPALGATPTIPANAFGIYAFFVDSAGTVTVAGPNAVPTTIGGAAPPNTIFPIFPNNKALIGFLLVTSTGVFTGGTTNLDAAGVTVVYVNPLGAFDPSVVW